MSELPASSVLDFLRLVGELKRTKRKGWVNSNVDDPESVADHMYRMSIISMLMPCDYQFRERLVKMALVHDLAEAVVGDITPFDGISKEEKHDKEKAAMLSIRDNILKGAEAGVEIFNLWKEYEDGESECAILMKDIDKFEMILQADEYEKSQGKDLSEFFSSTKGKFQSAGVLKLVAALHESRISPKEELKTQHGNAADESSSSVQ